MEQNGAASRLDPAAFTANTCTLEVQGMDCASCAASVEKALRSVSGVEQVQVDVMAGKAVVGYSRPGVARVDLARAVVRAGYQVKEPKAGPGGPVEDMWSRHGRMLLTALSGVLWAASLGFDHLLERPGPAAAFAILAIVAGGRYIIPRGVRAAMAGALDMNFLMSVAAVGALIIGEYEEAASAMFLFAVAQLLETYSMDRARNAVRALMELSPTEATVIRGGAELRVPVDQVSVGEVLVIRPGEKVPLDGTVARGRSTVNQAPITGESIPVEKEPGSEVFAGTLNGEGVLEVRSSRPADQTTLARIVHSVEEAQASRAPSQAFVDRFARIYTPAVVAGAVALAVLPPLLTGGGWSDWFYRALVLLVVACPCALVISTPVTIVSALAGAARRGILIKGGLHLESAGRARALAIDKTGTLTQGRPEVVDVVAFDGADVSWVLELAAAVEARSEHPLSRAILRHATERGIRARPASGTTAIVGKGVEARVDGQIVRVGSARLFADAGELAQEVRETVEEYHTGGRTSVLVGLDPQVGTPAETRIIGAIAIADQLRPEAAEALRELRRAGIRHVAVLTGDNAATARSIANELRSLGAAVDAVHAELLPEDKVEAVRELRRQHGAVLFVGDGINDAPALAAADVGIAMGTAGTDVALETADIALMTDQLPRLATTVRFARKAEGIIRANIAFSLLTKAAFVVLAALGYATLWMAVFADMGASLLVIMNGLRAMHVRS